MSGETTGDIHRIELLRLFDIDIGLEAAAVLNRTAVKQNLHISAATENVLPGEWVLFLSVRAPTLDIANKKAKSLSANALTEVLGDLRGLLKSRTV